MTKRARDDGGPVTIKKYANRRLYNTQSSSYITLDDLAKMTRDGVEFRVVDAKTDRDLTHSILTQIIMEEEAAGGTPLLPISFLRQMIAMYGHSMQAMMPQFLEATMDNFTANKSKWEDAMQRNMGGNVFARMAETNMAMMRAATEAFMPAAPATGAAANEKAKADRGDELSQMRSQMEEMRKRLDELGK